MGFLEHSDEELSQKIRESEDLKNNFSLTINNLEEKRAEYNKLIFEKSEEILSI